MAVGDALADGDGAAPSRTGDGTGRGRVLALALAGRPGRPGRPVRWPGPGDGAVSRPTPATAPNTAAARQTPPPAAAARRRQRSRRPRVMIAAGSNAGRLGLRGRAEGASQEVGV